jgi:hypothetical protein
MSTHSKSTFATLFTFLLGGLVVAGSLAGCSDETPPPPTFEVDESIVPPIASLPGFDGATDRPIATIEDERGIRGEFVSNELWLSTNDEAELDALVARWNGETLAELDPIEYGLESSGLSKQYLVRIDTAAADLTNLAADLQRIDGNATGAHSVSSEQGLGLIAIAAHEASGGASVGMNWVGNGADYRSQRVEEAPAGDVLVDDYDRNAFTWPTHSAGSTQNIGVAEAWRMLDIAGRLDNRVTLAVLDGGFVPDRDFSDDWDSLSNVPFTEAIGTENLMKCGESECPYHGTNVASAAMALPNNRFGTAGPGGPVSKPLFVFTYGDMFTSVTALGRAKLRGAKIANMSYGAPVPVVLGWSVVPFDSSTAAYHASGMLLFAAAGNSGDNVDHSRGAFGIEVETTWYTPCENTGVICVGGLRTNSLERDPLSNYGKKQVDIFAPFYLLVGPDPERTENWAQRKRGTSLSSPFVAGIAALIWAADPSLSANEVEKALIDTARPSPDKRVGRVVNALGAVLRVIGEAPPSILFDSLEDGDRIQLNSEIFLSATVEDLEDGIPCCAVGWSSDVDGELASGEGFVGFYHAFETPGPQTLTVTATDSDGETTVHSVSVEVVNAPPTVQLSNPDPGAMTFVNYPYVLRATGFDANEPNQRLDCESLTWTSDIASDPFPQTGCTVPVEFSSVGLRTIFVTGTDPQGRSATAEATLAVMSAPPNLPPAVTIVSPNAYEAAGYGSTLTLSGTASDPEAGGALVYTWTVQWADGSVVVGKSAEVQWRPRDTIPFTDYEDGSVVEVRVRLDVRDQEGSVGSDSVPLRFRVSK